MKQHLPVRDCQAVVEPADEFGARRLRRRRFLNTLVAATTGLTLSASIRAATESTPIRKRRKLRYLGWQVGITYQAAAPGGMTRDDLWRLIDEMARHRMNLLSLMMLSYGFFDAQHDGYCWPVQNPKLEHNRDTTSVNGQPDREFVRDAIAYAAERGIEVQLMMNWGIWNPEKMRRGYPGAVVQQRRSDFLAGKPTEDVWVHCPDAPDVWQAGLDEVADLLRFHPHSNVTSFAFERISYTSSDFCYCSHTQARFREDTGGSLMDASPERIESWKKQHITGCLKRYGEHVKKLRPQLGLWLHTQGASGWGHDLERMQECGVDYLLPHAFHFQQSQAEFNQMLQTMSPNKCVLHFSSRDIRPKNYPLWVKTPELIAELTDWVASYPGDNLAGLLFFNYHGTSAANRRAVYEQLKKFDIGTV